MPPLDGPNNTAVGSLQKRIKSLSGQTPLHFACNICSEGGTILIFFIASSAEIYRDISSNSGEASLGVRLEEAIKLAEKCASIRESLKLDEEFEELDIQATKLWNLSTTIARDSGDVEPLGRQNVLNGTPYFS